MRSQIPSLVGAVVVALVLLFLTGWLALIPNAVLAGIVANAVLALIEVGGLRALYRQRRSEFWIAAVCMASVLALGPLPAVIIAFLLSAIDVVRRAASPHTSVMAPLPEGHGFYPRRDLAGAMTMPGLIVFRFGAELFFANAQFFEERARYAVENAGSPVKWFVLDAEAVYDIDVTGAEALEQFLKYLEQRGIAFAVARAGPPVPYLLERYRLAEKIGPERRYATNRDALRAFLAETGQGPTAEVAPGQFQAAGDDNDLDH
jgi:SulP family sulfate permease